ncbi:MAG TPA: hypothetical protein VF235_01875 [Actinomycetota bacterium]
MRARTMLGVAAAAVAELVLMEIGGFWMMRKEPLAIRERAEGTPVPVRRSI